MTRVSSMKKKIKELTKEEKNFLCGKHLCSKCPYQIQPLAENESFSCFFSDIVSYEKVTKHKREYEDFSEKEVEVE